MWPLPLDVLDDLSVLDLLPPGERARAADAARELREATVRAALLGRPGTGRSTLFEALRRLATTVSELIVLDPSPARIPGVLYGVRSAPLDAAIVVVTVDAPLSTEDGRLLRQLTAAGGRGALCLNKVDLLTPVDMAAACMQVHERAAGLGVGEEVRIFPVAARRAREGHAPSGVDALGEWLDGACADLRDEERCRGTRLAGALCALAHAALLVERAGLAGPPDRRASDLQAFQAEIERFLVQVGRSRTLFDRGCQLAATGAAAAIREELERHAARVRGHLRVLLDRLSAALGTASLPVPAVDPQPTRPTVRLLVDGGVDLRAVAVAAADRLTAQCHTIAGTLEEALIRGQAKAAVATPGAQAARRRMADAASLLSGIARRLRSSDWGGGDLPQAPT